MNLVAAAIARAKEETPLPFAIIEGAIGFADAIDNVPNALPALYFLIEEEASEPSDRSTGPVLQRCEADLAMIIVTGNVTDTTGGAAAADLEVLKAAVRARFIGFVPDAATGEPLQHIGANLLKAKSGYVWHRELFSAATYLEEQA